jgi:hypothetical protein
MMLMLLATIASVLFWHYIVNPTVHYLRYQECRSYRLQEQAFKLRVVRSFIPEMERLSLQEIEEQFGLENLFDRVGRIR